MVRPVFARHPENPIVRPGGPDWRRCVTFNPGLLYDDDRFWLYERCAGGLRPFVCHIALLVSDDGVHFQQVGDQPVFSPGMIGSPLGSVQDPRVVRIDDRYLMTYAWRPFAWHSHPTGVGVPESFEPTCEGFSGRSEDNQTRSGIAVSADRVHWEHLAWPTPPELDDRDVILFPERIDGRYWLLRRPQQMLGVSWRTQQPSMWLASSADLAEWTEPELLAEPKYAWEGGKIGGATPPILTEAGWLVLYHGVEETDPLLRTVIYRAGAMLLDRNDPRRILARTPEPLLEPEAYYERTGLYIPNVVFPTGAVVRDGLLWVYYGVCDTAIALATTPVDVLLDHLLSCPA
ncbi:MAG: glycosidase [Armatimonadetes bacterium]|nr:glycosidase [Armatimonadota bacterium]